MAAMAANALRQHEISAPSTTALSERRLANGRVPTLAIRFARVADSPAGAGPT
jgi:hypothetical protein